MMSDAPVVDPNENSLLTKEEQEALKPKQVKVENPWIYQQTHQEYLDNIKVSTRFR